MTLAGGIDPRLAARARAPGRVQALALELIAIMSKDPSHATGAVRARLRESRHLHSNERRLVADGVFDLMRYGGVLDRLGLASPASKWDAWIGWQAGDDDRLPRARDEAVAAGDVATVAGVPAAVAAQLIAGLGDDAMAFAQASNERAPAALRANRARITREALAVRLAARGIATSPSPLAPHGLRVTGRANLEGTPEFQAGLFEMQDDASQAVAELASARGPVLDFCAGAGGKSLALAAAGLHVTATDIRAEALTELQRRARRARLAIETTVLAPEAPLPRSWRAQFPTVLVDAPCTGTGVWRRHPELRARAGDAAAFARRQIEIAMRAADAVSRDGSLVYATCSVLPVEGAQVVEALLAETGWTRRSPDRMWLPHREGTDGFFCAVIGPAA